MTDALPDEVADARRLARIALDEDGREDITSAVTVPAGTAAIGRFELRTTGVLAGQVYADAVAAECDIAPPTWTARDGDVRHAGATLGHLRGDLGRVLRAERPMLNFLQRATGIATATRAYVEAVEGTGCRILHTRKTAPGLRALDIGAVLAGGGGLHRTDLQRTVMVKDNHWRALELSGRTLADALAAARARGVTACQVEVETVSQVDIACAAGATRLLVDNQRTDTVATWARRARALVPGIEIEATGGITLENVRSYAEADVDFISVGALTHSVRAADIALEID